MQELQILIADDNACLRRAVARYFRLAGHAVLEACTGREAVQLISNNEVDAALLDIQMPELNGVEAARCIRDLRASLPILALTAWPEMIGTAHQHLFAEILIKPISPPRLIEIISKYVVRPRTGA